jgi:hypothetical protein
MSDKYVLGVDDCPHGGDSPAFVIIERATGVQVAWGVLRTNTTPACSHGIWLTEDCPVCRRDASLREKP